MKLRTLSEKDISHIAKMHKMRTGNVNTLGSVKSTLKELMPDIIAFITTRDIEIVKEEMTMIAINPKKLYELETKKSPYRSKHRLTGKPLGTTEFSHGYISWLEKKATNWIWRNI